MDPVREILEELKADPEKFKTAGGYERLLELLWDGHSGVAIKELLHGNAVFIGDLLWSICELQNVEPYVEEAALHIEDSDLGTAAYAIEVLLRGAQDSDHLRAALCQLESAPVAVREHAIRVLASTGLIRAGEVFRLGNWIWAAQLLDELLKQPSKAKAALEALVADYRVDHLVVALVLATLASEHDERAVLILEQSENDWVRSFAKQLREIFGRKWARSPRS